MNDEVGFLHAGKHENLLQIDTMILMGMVKHFQTCQNSKSNVFCFYMVPFRNFDIGISSGIGIGIEKYIFLPREFFLEKI